MRQIFGFIKTTIVGGLVFLLPIAAMVVIVVKAGAMAVHAVEPLAEKLPLPKGEAVLLVYVVGGVTLVLLCFAAGMIVRSFSLERTKTPTFMEPFLEKLPPYVALKRYADQLAGAADDTLQPALVRVNDSWQLGLIADSFSDEHVAVFLPTGPDATAGAIHIVRVDQVTPLSLSRAEANACLKRSGRGLREMMARTAEP